MPKLRYIGTSPIQAWNDLPLKTGDTIDVSEEQAAELLAVEPAEIEVEEFHPPRPGQPRKGKNGWAKVKKPNPRAGQRTRPEWEPASAPDKKSPAKSAGKE